MLDINSLKLGGLTRDIAKSYISFSFSGFEVTDTDFFNVTDDVYTTFDGDSKLEVRYAREENMIIVKKEETINNLERYDYANDEDKPKEDISDVTTTCYYSLVDAGEEMFLCRKTIEIEARSVHYLFFRFFNYEPEITFCVTEYFRVPSTFRLTDSKSLEILDVFRLAIPVDKKGSSKCLKKDSK